MGVSGGGAAAKAKADGLGVVPRVATAIFEGLAARRATGKHRGYEAIVRAQYLELYNEELRDLLAPPGANNAREPLAIRESDEGGGVHVVGASERDCTSAADILTLLEEGSSARVTASTLMNATSSRSHAIVTIMLEQRVPVGGWDQIYAPPVDVGGVLGLGLGDGTTPPATQRFVSKFHLLDLAGSERAKRTGAVGTRFKEGVAINSSLLTLGNVICALSDGDARKRGGHVPYRNSKLTRLLADSLGGNSRTVMLACVSPAEVNVDETLNTLRYAARARAIKNAPKVNRGAADENALNALRTEVAALRAKLGIGAGTTVSSSSTSISTAAASLASLCEALHASDADDAAACVGEWRAAAREAVTVSGELRGCAVDAPLPPGIRVRTEHVLARIAGILGGGEGGGRH